MVTRGCDAGGGGAWAKAMLARLATSMAQHAARRPGRGWLPSSREHLRAVGRGRGWWAACLRQQPPPQPPARRAKPRSGGGSRPCARQGRAQSKLSKEDMLRRHMPQDTLIIDDYAPWNAADRDRHRGLAGAHIDHRDVVAEAVRHEH